jgi:hypothetical protein
MSTLDCSSAVCPKSEEVINGLVGEAGITATGAHGGIRGAGSEVGIGRSIG